MITRQFFSIRSLVFIIILIICVISAGLIFSHWHTSTQRGLAQLETIQNIQNQSVIDTIEDKFSDISTNLATIRTIIINDAQILECESCIQRAFGALAASFPELATLSVADQKNNYLSVFRLNGSNNLLYARASSDGVMYSGTFDAWKTNKSNLQVFDNFFADQRPWFIKAIKNEGITWTPVYQYHATKYHAIGASQAIETSSGEKYVIAADYLLNSMNAMLEKISRDQPGVIILLDHKQNLIADSVNEDAKQQAMLNTIIGNDQQLSVWLQEQKNSPFHYNDVLVNIQKINQGGGEHFWLINAISETDTLAAINKQSRELIAYSIGMLLLSIVALYMAAKMIVSPIVKLEQVSKRIAKGQWDGEVPKSHIKEINNLSGAYRIMADEIKKTLNDLELKVAKRTQGLQTLNEQLEKSNITDPLTQIPNRRYFTQTMDSLFKTTSAVSLAIIDLDYFKKFNDRFGHLAGDIALTSVAKLIKLQLESATCKIARIGGEEFVAVFQSDNTQYIMAQLREFQDKLSKQEIKLPSIDHSHTLSVSIGLSLRKKDEDHWEKLYSRADQALYQAKAEGKDCIILQTD